MITTKVSGFGAPEGVSGGSPEWIAQAIDNSLRRLGTDYIDLYLLHMPDAKTPIGDTLEAFAKLVAAGKVREIGCSNFSAQMLEDAAAAAKELGVPQFVNVQNNYIRRCAMLSGPLPAGRAAPGQPEYVNKTLMGRLCAPLSSSPHCGLPISAARPVHGLRLLHRRSDRSSHASQMGDDPR